MNNRSSLSEMFELIENQVMCDSAPQLSAPFRLAEPVLIADHGKEPVIAIDSRPAPVPVIAGLEWMTNIPPDQGEMSEAAFVASLFEGVPHAIGERRVQEYQRQKQLDSQLAAAAARRRKS